MHQQSNSPRTGCAGWSIAGIHRNLFGPGDSMLARYASRFRVVEINSSFYRSHQRRTYARWSDSVQADFRFSVKLPRAITHDQRLRGSGALLDAFADEVSGLGQKLGGVLVQLPPSLAFDARVAQTFFAMLRRRVDAEIACEPRHASWFGPASEPIWQRHSVSRVAADPSQHPGGREAAGSGGWHYWRWHGSPRMYCSAYDDEALQALADRVQSTPAGFSPWIIFDNTTHGHATTDALRLQKILGVENIPLA